MLFPPARTCGNFSVKAESRVVKHAPHSCAVHVALVAFALLSKARGGCCGGL